jgi:LacI family transcriptional regulator
MENKKNYTINDVAKMIGYSKATVSRAMNNSKEINSKTKNKILKLIKEINYEPNNIARSLSKKRTKTIGVILEDILNPFYSEVAKEIEITLRKHGLLMYLVSSDWIYEEEIRITKALIGNKVDGILITPIKEDSEALKLLKQREVPFIVMNYKPKDKNISWITSDNIQGGYMATKHLIDLGHRNIMHLKGHDHQTTKDRLVGFKKAIKEKKSLGIKSSVVGSAKSFEDGYKLIKKILPSIEKDNIPTGIFAVNDFVAIGAMQALLEIKLDIPDDISIIGYDDINIAGKVRVPLTTIHQSKRRMGNIATVQLLDKISKADLDVARQFLMKPYLVKRDSTKKRD